MAPLNLHLLPGLEAPGGTFSQIEPGPGDVSFECPCDRAVLLSYGFGWTQGSWPPPQDWLHRVDAKSKPCRACEVLQRRRPRVHRTVEKWPWEGRHQMVFAAYNDQLHPNVRSYFDRDREMPVVLPRGMPNAKQSLPTSWKLHEVPPPPPPKPQSLIAFEESFKSSLYASQQRSTGFRIKSPRSPESAKESKDDPPVEQAKKNLEIRQPKKKPNARYVKPNRPVGYIKLPEVSPRREGRSPRSYKLLASSVENDTQRRNDPASQSEKVDGVTEASD